MSLSGHISRISGDGPRDPVDLGMEVGGETGMNWPFLVLSTSPFIQRFCYLQGFILEGGG